MRHPGIGGRSSVTRLARCGTIGHRIGVPVGKEEKMASPAWLAPMVAGMGGAVVVVLAGLLWNSASNGGLVRVLGGVPADQSPAPPTNHPGGSATAKWATFASKNAYNPSCDYRFHLIISPEKAAKMSINLSRYAGDTAFIYPTIISNHFMQALIIAPGEPIAIDLRETDGGECVPGQAALSNLPGICFDTKIEQRC